MKTAEYSTATRAEIEHDARELDRLARQIESVKATYVSEVGRKQALRVERKIAEAADAARALSIDLRVILEMSR